MQSWVKTAPVWRVVNAKEASRLPRRNCAAALVIGFICPIRRHIRTVTPTQPRRDRFVERR
ncbi:hypothetical protein [Komarekiella delphini-convector]|uniref:hypothetical protein n=1 Tax=Komarekiella delphini-convector TaxID=3050158 RepID=UPI001CD865C3|nr:hypothetical protein [Komarekiella delphini-convector]